ncbi:hypothetical protein TRFO_24368 [Tritrichomonas foetus]|uniref:Uncharacterized protein n=1 Tax=Tritrichomonas foetus TaxID=1144522 RepID=A0A1J4K7F8_9EUKA|nr:hypothetical protein TRFO_24368 [Tritrichomonas foetus]|eukprot:OHT07417.1 hypothetical protein TRFO_24368 [Tritrichomonas foetus]
MAFRSPVLVFECNKKPVLSLEAEDGFITIVNSDYHIAYHISCFHDKIDPNHSDISHAKNHNSSNLYSIYNSSQPHSMPRNSSYHNLASHSNIPKKFGNNGLSYLNHIPHIMYHDTNMHIPNLTKKSVSNNTYHSESENDNDDTEMQTLIPLNAKLENTDIEICSRLVKTIKRIAITATPWDRCFCLSYVQQNSNAESNIKPQYELKIKKRFHVRKISAIAVSEYRYATASLDGTVAIWKNEIGGHQVPAAVITKHNSPVVAIDINDVSNIIVSGALDGTIVTTSLMAGEMIKMITIVGSPNIIKVADSGTILAFLAYGAKSQVSVFDINLNKACEHTFESFVRCAVIFEWFDGQEMIAVGMRNRKVQIVKIPSFDIIWSFEGIDVSVLEIMKQPLMSLMIGTMDGKVMKAELEDADSFMTNDEKSSDRLQTIGLTNK